MSEIYETLDYITVFGFSPCMLIYEKEFSTSLGSGCLLFVDVEVI